MKAIIKKQETLEDGTYLGTWGGHVLQVWNDIPFKSEVYKFTSDFANKATRQFVLCEIVNGDIFVEPINIKTNAKKTH